MKIKRHHLYLDNDKPINYKASPNYKGDIIDHDFVVMHYTAGISAYSSISWLSSKQARASAHIIIARDGAITQLVPFNKCAWHAGRSTWLNRNGLNKYSIGIELDNAGKLTRQGESWVNWSGHIYTDDEVIVATHKNESSAHGWHNYTPVQIEAALTVVETLITHYPIKDVIGHDDIAPYRKTDPGPAFPMDSFKSRVFGRQEDEDKIMLTTANLNIRRGPGTEYAKLTIHPLPKNTPVIIYSHQGNWRFVRVPVEIENDMDIEGWVYGTYLNDPE